MAPKIIKTFAVIIISLYAIALLFVWTNIDREKKEYFGKNIIGDNYPESDFLVYWTASSLALSGKVSEVYNTNHFYQAEKKVIYPQDNRPWVYPPTCLLIILPLAWLPFLPSLIAWNAVTLVGYVAVLKRIAHYPIIIWLTFSFPAFFHNIIRGQNAFISGIFFGGGLLLLDHCPLVAGILLGVISFKPNLVFLIPLVLLAGGQWRALWGFVASAVGMAFLSLAIFGSEVWWDFIYRMLHQSQHLIGNPWKQSTTIFSAVRMLGSSFRMAFLIHFMVASIVAVVVTWVWYQGASLKFRASTLIIGTLLFSPRLLLYDLSLLAIPLAFLSYELLSYPFSWGRLAIFGSLWLMPFVAPILTSWKHISISPFVLLLLFIYVYLLIYMKKPDMALPSLEWAKTGE